METPTSFGLWLRQQRRILDLTQEALAQCAGCSVSAIRKIEADERRPSRQVAELLADCLHLAPEDRPNFLKVARAELRVERLAEMSLTASLPLPVEPELKLPYGRGELHPSPSLPSLPIPPTPFLGREHELAAIARLLNNPGCQLLTLMGPGGIGKTRLALEVTSRRRQEFADGAHFVSLASISSAEFIAPTVADALRLTLYGSIEPKAQLLTYLREKVMLLALDNFEHLLDGSGLLADILQSAPGVKLLVTSRELLHLQGEWVFEIQGLPVPPPEQTGELEAYSATALFLQSAQRAHVGFRIATEERPAVARLCRLVEGMPLGIELAAAWVRTLSCQEIAQEVERNLDFLSASRRDVPARHHSIRAVFDHSWNLLSAEEQRVMRQLSVFRGGFRREAAAQVAGASLPVLAGLVDKSLVSPPSEGRVGGRYHLHELLRQFSADKLNTAPAEKAATCERHSAYFLSFLQEREAGLKGKQQKAVLDELQAEIENVRSGWNWAVEQEQVEAIDRALDSLYQFYWLRSHFQEGEDAFRRAAEHLQALEPRLPPPERTPINKIFLKTLARQGVFCIQLGRYSLARDLLQHSLKLARHWETQTEIAFCLNFLGDIALVQRDHLAAERLYRESLAISQEVGDPLVLAEALWRLGGLNSALGDYLTAQSYLQQGLDLLREVKNQAGIASLLEKLGNVTFCLGEYNESEQYYQESLALFKEIGDRLGLSKVVGGLGLVAWGRGGARLSEARQLMEESLAICRESSFWAEIKYRFMMLGYISNSMGRYEEAQKYFQEALALTQQLDDKSAPSRTPPGLGEAALGLGNLQAARTYLLETLEIDKTITTILRVLIRWAMLLNKETDLPMAGMAADQEAPANQEKKQRAVAMLSLALNHPATLQVDKDKAARLLAQLEAELPPEAIAAAREWGQARTAEEVRAYILGQTES